MRLVGRIGRWFRAFIAPNMPKTYGLPYRRGPPPGRDAEDRRIGAEGGNKPRARCRTQEGAGREKKKEAFAAGKAFDMEQCIFPNEEGLTYTTKMGGIYYGAKASSTLPAAPF